MEVFGLAGWSGSGKTTLLKRLIPALISKGISVSTIKHAHHAFDIDKLESINVKSLKPSTKFKTLDESIIELDKEDLMICSSNKPLCLAGIYGGYESGVSDSTTNLFLESAIFDPITIR